MKLRYIIKGTLEETKLNPNIGTFSWLLHRLSGLMLLVYLFMHMWVLGSVNKSAAEFTARLKMVQYDIFHYLEIGLLLIIFYHMVNGLTITVMDFADISSKHRGLTIVSVSIFVILAIITLAIIIPRLLGGGH